MKQLRGAQVIQLLQLNHALEQLIERVISFDIGVHVFPSKSFLLHISSTFKGRVKGAVYNLRTICRVYNPSPNGLTTGTQSLLIATRARHRSWYRIPLLLVVVLLLHRPWVQRMSSGRRVISIYLIVFRGVMPLPTSFLLLDSWQSRLM